MEKKAQTKINQQKPMTKQTTNKQTNNKHTRKQTKNKTHNTNKACEGKHSQRLKQINQKQKPPRLTKNIIK